MREKKCLFSHLHFVEGMEPVMLADAVAVVCSAVCGTSTVSSYVKVSAGIAEGGKTGPGRHDHRGLFTVMFLVTH